MSQTSPEFLKEPTWIKFASMGFAGFNEQAALQDDHLLVVTTRGFVERYRRIKFEDISGILVCRDRRWLYWMLIPLAEIVVALFMIFYIQQAKLWMPLEIFYLWMVLAVIKAALNLAAGPTCTVTIQTAVQQFQLDSLHRWHNLQSKIAPLKHRVQQVQGDLDHSQVAVLKRQVIAKHDQKGLLDKGSTHLLAGFGPMMAALAILLYGLSQSTISFFMFFLAVASTGLNALIALRKQHDQPMFGLLAGAAWVSLTWCFVAFSVFFTTVIYVALVDDVLTTEFSIQPYVHYFVVDLRKHDIVFYSYLLVVLFAALCFLVTLAGFAEYRQRYQRGAHE